MSNYKRFLSISILLLLSALQTTHGHYDTHECHHGKEEFNPGFLDVSEGIPSAGGRTLEAAPNMRIETYFDLLTDCTTTFRNYVMLDLVPPVAQYFQSALRVKYPLKENLKVGTNIRSICGYETPEILKTSGVVADHFIFFTASSETSNFVATSQSCYLSTGVQRPLISRVKLNTQWLEVPNDDPLLHESNTNVLIHELMHSFGFSSSLFPFFIDENGVTRTGHVKSVSVDGTTRPILDVPSLTNRIRKHFGCSSIPGAFLENNGDPEKTAGSHFERSLFVLELMTSGMLHGRRLSELSLAVLEASGWYAPDYNYAEPYHFGAGQGCDFTNKKCSDPTAQFNEFCNTASERGCFASGRGGGMCKSDANSDGCMFYYPSIYFDCENPQPQTRLKGVQVFGREAGSKCFEGTLSNKQNDKQNTFCFKYDCFGSGVNTQLEVQVGNHKIMCKEAGQVQVEGYHGAIKCPDPLTFCQTMGKEFCPKNCMGRGTCHNNKCSCYAGYTGIDCGLRI